MRVLVLVLLLSACADTNTDCNVCTDEFRLQVIQVVDQAGQPAVGLHATTTRVSDHEDLTPPADGAAAHLLGPGEYAVATDDNLRDYSSSPEQVVFAVSGPAGSAQSSGSVVTDECGCHVIGYDGPRMLALQ